MTSGSYAQIAVRFNCWAETESFMNSPESANHRLLLQYSVNGGITWILIQVLLFTGYYKFVKYLKLFYLKEIKMQPNRDPQLLIVDLMKIPDLTNCTRIRMWQPIHTGTN